MGKRTNHTREEIDGYAALEELALDFLWNWNRNHIVKKIWQVLDPELWELLKNPWVILQTVSQETLERQLSNPDFRKMVDELLSTNRLEQKAPTWFQSKFSKSPLTCIAYFSMEFMLGEALPIYSGGLGNVAGDQLKAASDLGVPVIGIGLLYQQGYFRQMIDKDGTQQALYPYNDPGQLPIMPLRRNNGEWLRIEIVMPGWSVWLRAWEVKVGRVKLYLLDSNDAVNLPIHRGITSELYGGGSELRLKQELVLGIGGWRLLKALGINPEVCHLNEGHAAFAILERTENYMRESSLPFESALAVTRGGNLFTTHTAVPAGFDRFTPFLIEQYLSKHAQEKLGITLHELLALGRLNPNDPNEPFNMAYLAIRGSGSINGVSYLHGKVSRRIFENLFPRWPENEVPVGHVTNGVHMPSWSSVATGELWMQSCGKSCWMGNAETIEKDIRAIPDVKIWELRNNERASMIEYARSRLSRMWAARGFPQEEIDRAKTIFDPNTLTLGFARRFATYKRPNLLLHNKERLLGILNNPQRPVQLVIAGKAHPADKPGQEMIREWINLFHDLRARNHVIFLTDYDMLVTQNLVRGVDLWINTPRRPWEACGTSGMKVLPNGGLNLSELDGWWAEAFSPPIGWALGDGKEHGDDPNWDAAEANALYDLLENAVVPEFYTRDNEGIPTAWVARIRESMAQLTPRFSADRAVREYTENHYIPAALKFQQRATDKGSFGKKIVEWQHALKQHWAMIRFGEMKVNSTADQHTFEVQLYLDDIDPNAVMVELYAGVSTDDPPIKQEMSRVRQLAGNPQTYVYSASVPATQPAYAYTPRVIPRFPDASVPLEASQILWQK
jgi:glycogen phosphorylase